jgi:uncharacterized protein DUF5684
MAWFVHGGSPVGLTWKAAVRDIIMKLPIALPLLRSAKVLWLACLLMLPGTSWAAIEETFDVLQIGTHTYRNVTVTTKARNYIFIMHSTGMLNIKVADLSPELRTKLGYTEVPGAKGRPVSLSTWTKHTMAKMHLPQAKDLEREWRAHAPPGLASINFTPNLALIALGTGALLYILMCYGAMLICQKTGNPAGALVWVPVLQLVPLLRAAGMSPAWLLAFLVPVLNVIAQIVWSFNIARARGKSGWVGFFLILPITCLFAYFYLALAKAPRKEEPVIEIMTLESA